MSRTFEVREMSAYDLHRDVQLFRWDILLDNDVQLSATLPRWMDLIEGEWEHRKSEAIAELLTAVQDYPDTVESLHLDAADCKTRYFEVTI